MLGLWEHHVWLALANTLGKGTQLAEDELTRTEKKDE